MKRNKRVLKGIIHGVCEELFAEGMAVTLYGPKSVRDNADSILTMILHTEREFISRVSHPEPGMAPRVYYNDLREKLSERVGEIIDQFRGDQE
ncbi:MAG: hypothetical protein K5764_03235 [Prevotella sp.]|nr:hypothetical protein [Prevotella sp.]